MPNNYVLLDRIELNATASSITFDNIPQTGYTDLKVVVSTRGTLAQIYDGCSIEFNGSTTGYSWRQLQGSGSAASSASGSTYPEAITSGASSTASTFGNAEFYIPNAFGSNQKSVSVDSVGENNATTTYARMQAGLWTGTASITSIKLIATGGSTFVSGSTFSLYGLAALGTTPAIAPKADGGNVIGTDGTYWYHAFLSNGTFTPQVALNADVLVVAGGGGGGSGGSTYACGGGGGAGGLLAYTSQSLATSTNYALTIGAAGAGGVGYSNVGTNGSNSQFASLTASVGGGKGGGWTQPVATGGSGGGGSGYTNISGNETGAAGTAGQGFAGGTGDGTAGVSSRGGGGGGSTAIGTNGSSGVGGNGGTGNSSYSAWATATATGLSGNYAGGGGAGGVSTGGSGAAGGGNGGGANGNGVSATINTGSGGGGSSGGAGGGASNGGNGSSGIVIIRYLVA